MKKKQISIVLETDENFDELGLIAEIKKFLSSFHQVNLVGTHTKILNRE